MVPPDPGTSLKPTIMNTSSFEAGGDLSTPVDPDNVNSLSLLLKTPSKHYNREGLAKMIKDFGNKHSHFLGIKNLEKNMHSLVTAVIKLDRIDPIDPDCHIKRIEVERKVEHLILCLTEQMACIRLCAINHEENLVTLEKDFSDFIKSYRTERIRVSQIQNRYQPNVFGVSIPTFSQITAHIQNDQLKILEDNMRQGHEQGGTLIQGMKSEICKLQSENKDLIKAQSMASAELDRTKEMTSKTLLAMKALLELQGVQRNMKREVQEKKRGILDMNLRTKFSSPLLTPHVPYETILKGKQPSTQCDQDWKQSAVCPVKTFLDNRSIVSSKMNQKSNDYSYQRETNQMMTSGDTTAKQLWSSDPGIYDSREHVCITPITNSEAALFCIYCRSKVKDFSDLDLPFLVDPEEEHQASESIIQPEVHLPVLTSQPNSKQDPPTGPVRLTSNAALRPTCAVDSVFEKDAPTSEDFWAYQTRHMALKSKHLINLLGVFLLQLGRVGATTLLFLCLLLDLASRRQNMVPFEPTDAYLYAHACGMHSVCPACIGACPCYFDPASVKARNTTCGIGTVHCHVFCYDVMPMQPSDFLHQPAGMPTSTFSVQTTHCLKIRDSCTKAKGWLLNPGILWARKVIRQWKPFLHNEHEQGQPLGYSLITGQPNSVWIHIPYSFQPYCRLGNRHLCALLPNVLSEIVKTNRRNQSFKEYNSTEPYHQPRSPDNLTVLKPCLEIYLAQSNLLQLMLETYTKFFHLISKMLFHLKQQNQKHLLYAHGSSQRRNCSSEALCYAY